MLQFVDAILCEKFCFACKVMFQIISTVIRSSWPAMGCVPLVLAMSCYVWSWHASINYAVCFFWSRYINNRRLLLNSSRRWFAWSLRSVWQKMKTVTHRVKSYIIIIMFKMCLHFLNQEPTPKSKKIKTRHHQFGTHGEPKLCIQHSTVAFAFISSCVVLASSGSLLKVRKQTHTVSHWHLANNCFVWHNSVTSMH